MQHSSLNSSISLGVLSNKATNVLSKGKKGEHTSCGSANHRQSILPTETVLITVTFGRHTNHWQRTKHCSTSLLSYLFIIIANHCLMKHKASSKAATDIANPLHSIWHHLSLLILICFCSKELWLHGLISAHWVVPAMVKLPARDVEAGYRVLNCGGAKWNPLNALSSVNDALCAVD